MNDVNYYNSTRRTDPKAAFTELLARHVNLGYSKALRMKTRLIYLIALVLTGGSAHEAGAQTLVQQPLDLVLQGDDPSQVFNFDLPLDPLQPTIFRFDGVFQNLAADETGVRYFISWGAPEAGNLGIDFTRLAASGQLPVHLEQTLPYTPDSVFLLLEGGGPTDFFRFDGAFSIQQVPEPSPVAVFASASVIAALCWLLRRRRMPTPPKL